MPFIHRSFVIERDLPGSTRHAFRFFADLELKRRWTSCHPDWTVLEDRMDFRVGGAEVSRWRRPDGGEQGFAAHYLAIMAGEHIVYAYSMDVAGRQISSSLVTLEFTATNRRTRMTFTEQAAFMAAEDADIRESGTGIGFDRLVAVMEKERAPVH